MADWNFKPLVGYRIEPVDGGPTTLVTQYEDKSQSIRVKDTTEKNIYIGVFRENDADFITMNDIWEAHKFDLPLTILAFNPFKLLPATNEALVRFMRPKGSPIYIGPSQLDIRWVFRDV